MVGDTRRALPQAGDVRMPVLQGAAAVHDRAHADPAGGRHAAPAACAHVVRDGREARGAVAVARSVAPEPAAAAGTVLSVAGQDSNPLTAACVTHRKSLLSLFA